MAGVIAFDAEAGYTFFLPHADQSEAVTGSEGNIAAAEENYDPCWPAFVEFAGSALTPELRETGERFGKSIRKLMNQFGEATGIQLKALLTAGFVLFMITLVVNTLAAIVVNRSRSGTETS